MLAPKSAVHTARKHSVWGSPPQLCVHINYPMSSWRAKVDLTRSPYTIRDEAFLLASLLVCFAVCQVQRYNQAAVSSVIRTSLSSAHLAARVLGRDQAGLPLV